MHVEYADYRLVGGIKMPFAGVTWTDGQSTTQLTAVQPNVTIAAAKFAKPAPLRRPSSRPSAELPRRCSLFGLTPVAACDTCYVNCPKRHHISTLWMEALHEMSRGYSGDPA